MISARPVILAGLLCTLTFLVFLLLAVSSSAGPGSRTPVHGPLRANRSAPPRLPSRPFQQVSPTWSGLDHLIIVPGHAIQWCTELRQANLLDESCWYLLEYQRGQLPLYLEHVRRAVRLAREDPRALLVFSGGQTRGGLGPRSEGQSYFALAEHLGLLDETLYDRTMTEEFARDSLENLVFSQCRFRQITGHLPRRVTVVGFPFKARRFVELHSKAAALERSAFTYVAVAVPGLDQSQLVDDAYAEFSNDLFGCGERLLGKRRTRNPYHGRHGYRDTCPELQSVLDKCPA